MAAATLPDINAAADSGVPLVAYNLREISTGIFILVENPVKKIFGSTAS
ncbi:MAG: hypothetical protein ACREQO_19885 [Candidatus Binatia bacterium]